MSKWFDKKDVFWIVGILIVVVLLRLFIFTPIIVRGHSMDPNLQDGERLIGLKLGGVERLDIVALDAPNASGDEYIKRVIGLPGETVEFVGDVLYIDGEEMDEPYLDEFKAELPEGEQLTGDFSYAVPEGQYFVMGDNRRNSNDSRFFGSIPADTITEVAKFAFWPLDRFGTVN